MGVKGVVFGVSAFGRGFTWRNSDGHSTQARNVRWWVGGYARCVVVHNVGHERSFITSVGSRCWTSVDVRTVGHFALLDVGNRSRCLWW